MIAIGLTAVLGLAAVVRISSASATSAQTPAATRRAASAEGVGRPAASDPAPA
jgi:hypothetical protein